VLSQVASEAPDPFALSLQGGLMACSAVATAVQLQVPDALADEPQTIEVLAEKTNTHAPSLYLLLRALAGIGIFVEVDQETHTFAHTTRSRALQAGTDGSMVDLVSIWAAEYQWDAWRNLAHTIRTGRPALEVVYGEQANIWTYLQGHPEDAQVFQRGLTANANLVIPAILSTSAFSSIRRLVDVGSGYGQLGLALLERYPEMDVTLFDRPTVIAQAQKHLSALPETIASRCTTMAGDFFIAIPTERDGYVLKNVLMDWSDRDYLQILRCCRAAMDPDKGRLIIIEPVIGPETPFTLFFSLQMAMMMKAARHRTLEEHQALFEQAGFRLARTHHLGLEQMMLEGTPIV
jgi:SAM-dependent methyltransferase